MKAKGAEGARALVDALAPERNRPSHQQNPAVSLPSHGFYDM